MSVQYKYLLFIVFFKVWLLLPLFFCRIYPWQCRSGNNREAPEASIGMALATAILKNFLRASQLYLFHEEGTD
jgi:hypothetical protein